MVAVAERGVWLADPAQRADLAAFTERTLRLDDAAVIRLRTRSDTTLMAWVATGFDVLAGRVLQGRVRPHDLSVGADELGRVLASADQSGYVDPGFAMDSAWRGVLPPDAGFAHLDDVPARVMLDLAQRAIDAESSLPPPSPRAAATRRAGHRAARVVRKVMGASGTGCSDSFAAGVTDA